MESPEEIRPIAICVFRDAGRVFVGRFADPSTGEMFHRPLGGGIRFGERGRDCIARELREELGAEVKGLTYVGMLENLFTYDGKPHHEIVLVYEASFAAADIYGLESMLGRDDGGEFVAMWRPIAEFETGTAVLYPDGLLDLLGK